MRKIEGCLTNGSGRKREGPTRSCFPVIDFHLETEAICFKSRVHLLQLQLQFTTIYKALADPVHLTYFQYQC